MKTSAHKTDAPWLPSFMSGRSKTEAFHWRQRQNTIIQTAPLFVDLALHLLISNALSIHFIHGSELADPPQQRLSVYQALVGVSLLWVNKPSGSHQTCKRRFHEWIITWFNLHSVSVLLNLHAFMLCFSFPVLFRGLRWQSSLRVTWRKTQILRFLWRANWAWWSSVSKYATQVTFKSLWLFNFSFALFFFFWKLGKPKQNGLVWLCQDNKTIRCSDVYRDIMRILGYYVISYL